MYRITKLQHKRLWRHYCSFQAPYSTERFVCHWSLSLSSLLRPSSSFSKYSSANKWMGTMSSLFRSLYCLEKHTNKIRYTALAPAKAMLVVNHFSVQGKMAYVNLHKPVPIAELSPTDTATSPVMSPRIECGVWANTQTQQGLLLRVRCQENSELSEEEPTRGPQKK